MITLASNAEEVVLFESFPFLFLACLRCPGPFLLFPAGQRLLKQIQNQPPVLSGCQAMEPGPAHEQSARRGRWRER